MYAKGAKQGAGTLLGLDLQAEGRGNVTVLVAVLGIFFRKVRYQALDLSSCKKELFANLAICKKVMLDGFKCEYILIRF